MQLRQGNSMENFKIIEERENPLFKRKEIKISIDAEVSPNRTDILKSISEKFSVPADNIIIKKIHGKFGSKNFTISANLYSSKEEKENTEIMPKHKEIKKYAGEQVKEQQKE